MTVARRHAGAFLPAMLQGVHAEEGDSGGVLFGMIDARDAAGFSGAVVEIGGVCVRAP